MPESIKAIARAAALVAVSPALLSFAVRGRLVGRDRALEGSTQALAFVPGILGQYLRRAFLGRTLACCAATATIEFGTIFSQAGTRIGPRAYLGPRCHIGLADIGADVLLAAGVHVPSGGATHGVSNLDVPIREQPGERTMIRLGEGAWIGSAAVVMADVGRGTVVGAGAVVTKPLPDFVIAAGVPARVIRSRRDTSVHA